MADEYNPMQDPTSAVERAKRKTAAKVRKQAGRAVTTDPNAAPAQEPTRVQGPTVERRDTDVQKAAGVPQKRELPLQRERRPKANVRMEKVPPPKTAPKSKVGGLTEEEMNVKAPGYFRKGRYMTKPPPKPAPKKDLTASTIGGLKQPTPSQMGVSPQTGKPKQSTWQRVKAYATRAERPERAPRTMGERLGSIGRTAQRTFPAEKGVKTGGILNIEELRRQSTGPMGQTQRPRTPPPARELSLEEKQRKGMRVTGADVPGTGLPAGRGVGIPEITREEGGTGLGKFTGKGYKAPAPTPTRGSKPTAQAPKVPWYMKAARAFQKAGREMTAEAQKSTAPSGRYGTKEQAQKGAKAVKKAVVPKTFKE